MLMHRCVAGSESDLRLLAFESQGKAANGDFVDLFVLIATLQDIVN